MYTTTHVFTYTYTRIKSIKLELSKNLTNTSRAETLFFTCSSTIIRTHLNMKPMYFRKVIMEYLRYKNQFSTEIVSSVYYTM